jgi:hypothetical protein
MAADIEQLRRWLRISTGQVVVGEGMLARDLNQRQAGAMLAVALPAVLDALEHSRDIYTLREAGLRVLDDEQCCELACSSGACESCPCCQAGWCVWGHHVEIPDRDLTPASNYRIWLDTAKDHNPVAKLLAELEGAIEVEYDEAVPS